MSPNLGNSGGQFTAKGRKEEKCWSTATSRSSFNPFEKPSLGTLNSTTNFKGPVSFKLSTILRALSRKS